MTWVLVVMLVFDRANVEKYASGKFNTQTDCLASVEKAKIDRRNNDDGIIIVCAPSQLERTNGR